MSGRTLNGFRDDLKKFQKVSKEFLEFLRTNKGVLSSSRELRRFHRIFNGASGRFRSFTSVQGIFGGFKGPQEVSAAF